MNYVLAERFKSIQGEGVYAGTPMAFLRFVGCSVGKRVCVACDTDFEESVPWRGGGIFDENDLVSWAGEYDHICLTGGEPFDQDLLPLLTAFIDRRWARPGRMIHVETSGTKDYSKLLEPFTHGVTRTDLWICVSPKPGFLEHAIAKADEVKVIMPGLGVLKHGSVLPVIRKHEIKPLPIEIESVLRFPSVQAPQTSVLEVESAWPTLEDALRWAKKGKTVFIQPRNEKNDVNMTNLRLCQDIVAEHPQLRLSMQLHKFLRVQ
jgi:organic radical activating enzyme